MPYVGRDETGHVCSLFADPQENWAKEFLPDDHPEVIAFKEAMIRARMPMISDRQFFQALALKGLIKRDEALAAVQHGAIPEILAGFLAQITDQNEHFAAQMVLSGATQFQRNHSLVNKFGHAAGMTDVEIDDLWTLAASL